MGDRKEIRQLSISQRRSIAAGRYAEPRRCLQSNPTPQSVCFCGCFINLTTIALHTGLTVGHISLVFSGKRKPSLASAKKIANALNMDMHSFVTKLDDHVGLQSPPPLKKVVNS